ncbi:AHH domain-containing protein [Agarilytica rhodophyticola]|uniref:AHH domain-containing protein n=1 Tax=Agarilytica rhodophyticola TaxID=1737490 RepID=UPI001FE81B19|nr:AHH domain-containing protein [Agarilytica rhodophyticola]
MAHLEPSDHIKNTHLKSLLDVVFEQSQKELKHMRSQLDSDSQELAKKEREFMFKECAKLENIGKLQSKLDAYREANSSMTPAQRAKECLATDNSEKLGNHLRAIGQFRCGFRWQAHHIVCSRHGSHAAARFILLAYMLINDPFNGCWLPQKHKYAQGTPYPNAVGHVYLHTNDYAQWVTREIRPANNLSDLIRRLQGIRLKLIDARNLPDILTAKGKQDLRTIR